MPLAVLRPRVGVDAEPLRGRFFKERSSCMAVYLIQAERGKGIAGNRLAEPWKVRSRLYRSYLLLFVAINTLIYSFILH